MPWMKFRNSNRKLEKEIEKNVLLKGRSSSQRPKGPVLEHHLRFVCACACFEVTTKNVHQPVLNMFTTLLQTLLLMMTSACFKPIVGGCKV